MTNQSKQAVTNTHTHTHTHLQVTLFINLALVCSSCHFVVCNPRRYFNLM